ncbi:helix-turn-helix domain-containing protein [Sulfitobacter dubius]|uniref:Response regulator protein TmoT n=1 Tax=Sulfitobacter dubius TaxID=218673 RepID=A0ABY3ZSB3_9RHOB|nr:helix-turn-helix transcriptional regulator [Sulfitobacter dubius]UOA16995.1 Response regulator protein TmoT [Sulfitobacter dubius]
MTEVTPAEKQAVAPEIDPAGVIPIDQVYNELATVISAVGNQDFYDRMSRFVARALCCDQRLVMRYSAFERPNFIINNFMNPEAERLYLSGLFRIDPLQEIARTSRTPAIVNLRAASDGPPAGDEYLTEIFKLAFIFDELAFLLPAPGGVTFAICCEKINEAFTAEEQAHAHAMLPTIVAIHERHLDAIFSRPMQKIAGDDSTASNEDAYLILDCAGNHIFASERWQTYAACLQGDTEREIEKARQAGETHLALSESLVLHWEPLGPQIQIAPGGMLMRVEGRSADDIEASTEEMIDLFCTAQALTPRESDIVKLILQGYPNSKISEQLDISAGTVKNHRWRLYYKLDITSERELFLLFLSELLAR